MRINFNSRADRNLFCQARLIIPQPGANSMLSPPRFVTPYSHHSLTPPPTTISCHHLLPLPACCPAM
jgi:hypothetical protein